MNISRFKILSILFVLMMLFFTVTSYAQDRTGNALGFQISTGIVKPDVSLSGFTSTVQSKSIYGAGFSGEFMFTDFLGLGYGAGFKYYEMDVTVGGTNAKYKHIIASIPVTLRFRPMGLISPGSSFTFFVGGGFDFQPSIAATSKVSGSTTTGTFTTGLGGIVEGGIGFYATQGTLIEGFFKYNQALKSISKSTFEIKPNMIEFGVRFMFK